MLTVQESIFELCAVKDDYVTEGQIRKALKEQKRLKLSGHKKALDEVLIELGHLTSDQAAEIRDRLDEEIIPGYRLHEEIGRGGMGVVYRATQVSMEREVAVKVLSKRLSKDQNFCKKFLQEARNAAKLNHENIMGGIDCGEASGLHYFVMELVNGESLQDILDRDGPLDVERAFAVLEQVARGLKHAHSHSIVHRDIKPDNIMVTKDNVAKICDFGLAKPARKEGQGVKGATCEGTPYYCAPEQALGRTDIDAKADIYALGATLYHLLTGETPFDGENARKILWHQVNTTFPDIRQACPSVQPDQAHVLHDMVIKDRKHRMSSATELLERLQDMKAKPGAPSRRVSRVALDRSNPLVVPGVLLLLSLTVLGIIMSMGSGDGVKDGDINSPIAQNPKPNTNDQNSGDTKTGDPKNTDPKPKKDPKPDGPAIVHIDKPDKQGVDINKLKQLNLAERQAQLLLKQAAQFESDYPEQVEQALGKYQRLIDRFPKSGAAKDAQSALGRLRKRGVQLVGKRWQLAVKEVKKILDEGQFRKALATIERFRESNDARLLMHFDGRIKKLQESAHAQAQREFDSLALGLRQWADKAKTLDDKAFQPLNEFRGRAPVAFGARIDGLIADIRKSAEESMAQRALREILAQVDALVKSGQLQAAQDKLKAALTLPDLDDDGRKALAKLQGEVVDLARVWTHFDGEINSLKGKKQDYPSKSEEITGTLLEYKPKDKELVIKIYGRREEQTVELSELKSEFIVALAPSASDLRSALTNMRFFMAKGLIDAALVCLKQAKSFGLSDPALEKQLSETLVRVQEEAAAKLVQKLMSLPPGKQAVNLVRRLAKEFSKSKAYTSRVKEIKEAFLLARAQDMVNENPDQLFHCKASRTSRKELRYKLSYKFEDKAELQDWLADKKTLGSSNIKHDGKKIEVTGKIQHKVRFAGGAIKVDLKVTPLSRQRPNLNLILSDQGGRNGLFVGVGTKMNAKAVRLSGKAPKRAGARVALPANLIADINGKNWDYLVAGTKPKLVTDRSVRYIVERSKRNTLTAKVNGRTYLSLGNAPRGEQAGSIGLYLDKVKMVIETVNIEGVVDQAWLVDYARQTALKEAETFPGMAPPKPAKKPQKK